MGRTVTALHRSRAARPCLVALLLALTAAVGAPAAVAQPSFEADVVAFRANDGVSSRLDLYTRVSYRGLNFLRRDEGFTARYTVSVAVHRPGRDGRPAGLVHSRTWERRASAGNYVATQADSLADYAVHTLDVAPGRYALVVLIQDVSTRRTTQREIAVDVPSFTEAIGVSDILLADRYDVAQQRLSPNVVNAVDVDRPELTLFFEVYARQAENLRVRYGVQRPATEGRRSLLAGLLGRRSEVPPVRLNERTDWVTASGRTPVAFPLELDGLDVGEYEVTVRVEHLDGTVVAEREKPFVVRWSGLPPGLQDLDTAIAQLRYIAKERDLRAMQEARTYDERLRLFREFWDRRDPTPSSRRNERMEEYYYRISHANRHYGHAASSGWETDQGEVFVRFGEPDRIERHPQGQNARPYHVWYYTRMGRRFIFVDESGRGEFRLLVPIWDERTRM
jgi:GWxTD domain-containing protein